jgi:hypothetical protein
MLNLTSWAGTRLGVPNSDVSVSTAGNTSLRAHFVATPDGVKAKTIRGNFAKGTGHMLAEPTVVADRREAQQYVLRHLQLPLTEQQITRLATELGLD